MEYIHNYTTAQGGLTMALQCSCASAGWAEKPGPPETSIPLGWNPPAKERNTCNTIGTHLGKSHTVRNWGLWSSRGAVTQQNTEISRENVERTHMTTSINRKGETDVRNMNTQERRKNSTFTHSGEFSALDTAKRDDPGVLIEHFLRPLTSCPTSGRAK